MKLNNIKKIVKSKRSNCRYLNSKAGTTLMELVAVVAILAIISTTGIGAMFNMTKIAKTGQNISATQRTFEIFNSQILIYMNTATEFRSYVGGNSLLYDGSGNEKNVDVTKYYDAVNNTSDSLVTYFITASPTEDNTIVLSKMDKSSGRNCATRVSKLSGISKVEFTLQELPFSLLDASVESRYLIKYTIYSTTGYEIYSGIVMNNEIHIYDANTMTEQLMPTFNAPAPEGDVTKITIYCNNKDAAAATANSSFSYHSSSYDAKNNTFIFSTTNRQNTPGQSTYY